MSDENGVSIIHRGHLTIRFDKKTVSLNYTGNMGSSTSNIDRELRSLGLFEMADIRRLPSFYEEGSPDYLYSATVTLVDLSQGMRERISTLLQKVTTTSVTPEVVSDVDVSDAGMPRRLPERRGREARPGDNGADDELKAPAATATEETLSALGDIAEIAQAMRDAPTLATADPRFWVVQQRRWREVPEDAGGELRVWDSHGADGMSCEDFAMSWLEWLMERDDWDESACDVCLGTSIVMSAPEEGERDVPENWVVRSLDERKLICDFEEGVVCPGYSLFWRDCEYETVDNTFFLTLAECEEHIRLNHYHYDHPRPFCMHAWRAPQVERLWKALKSIDWERVRATVGASEDAG